MQFALVFGGSDFRTVQAQAWADEITKRTSGRINITLYPGGSLVTGDQAFRAISTGTIELAQAPSTFFESTVTEVQMLGLSGVYPEDKKPDVAQALLPVLDRALAPHHAKFLFTTWEGPYFIQSSKPLNSLADIKGLKLRDTGLWSGKVLSALGASPVTIPLSDTPSALQRGTIDGAVWADTVVYSLKAYEFAKYAINTHGNCLMSCYIINLDVWNKISPEDQKIITQVSKEVGQSSVQIGSDLEKKYITEMVSSGLKIYDLSTNAKDKEALSKAVLAVQTLIEAQSTPLGKELIKALEPFKIQ